MCRDAQRWAIFLAMKNPGELHDRECRFGENIYEKICPGGSKFDKSEGAVAAANYWYGLPMVREQRPTAPSLPMLNHGQKNWQGANF